MVPTLVSDIISLPGWNTPMLLLLAKATLILVCALGITVAMQRGSAGARHLVWLATLATLLLVPAVTAWAPPLRIEILPPKGQTEITPAPKALAPTLDAAAPSSTTQPEPSASTRRTGNFIESATATRFSGLSLLFTLWAGIALALGAWLAYGAFSVRRIVRNAHPLDTQDWLKPLWEVADRLDLDEPPLLLGSDEARMPFACGFTKPTIVLPSDCDQWTPDRRRAVLLHELAHVKRHDLVGHTLGRIACAVYWFHPLVWTAAKQLRNESERACDDLALSCGARASDYAEHLLDIVTSVRRDSTPVVALAMARRKEFEGRMLAILDPELRHSSPGRKQSIALIGSLAAMAIVVGAAAPAPRASIVRSTMIPQAAAVDSDFTPNDVAQKDEEMPSDVRQEKKTSKVLERAIEKHTVTSTSTSVDKIVRDASNDAARLSIQALAQLGIDFRTGQGGTGRTTADDRPILLANVLRTDADPALRRTAAWGLSEYADTKVAMDALVEALRKDADASVREMSAWALADGTGTSASVAALSTAIRNDASENVRATAIWALGNVGDRYALDALVDILPEKSKRLRSRAVWAIGNIDPHEAPKALVALLRDPDPELRELTAWALFQIEDPSAAPALNAALKTETDKDLQIAYIRALAALGEKSVDAIRELLTSSDPKIKSMAVRALAGGNAAGPWPWPWPEPRPYP